MKATITHGVSSHLQMALILSLRFSIAGGGGIEHRAKFRYEFQRTMRVMSYVDLTYLREIAAGDERFMAEVIHSFIRLTPAFCEEVQLRLQEKDCQQLKAAAHRLKSAALYLGMAELARMISIMEEEVSGGANWEILPPLVSKMNLVLKASLAELTEELQKFTMPIRIGRS